MRKWRLRILLTVLILSVAGYLSSPLNIVKSVYYKCANDGINLNQLRTLESGSFPILSLKKNKNFTSVNFVIFDSHSPIPNDQEIILGFVSPVFSNTIFINAVLVDNGLTIELRKTVAHELEHIKQIRRLSFLQFYYMLITGALEKEATSAENTHVRLRN